MLGIFAHGNKIIISTAVLIFMVLISLFSFKLNEKKCELKKNKLECEQVIENIEEQNRQIVKEIEL